MSELPMREAVFFRKGKAVLFAFKIDEGNVIGPRLMTAQDRENHPDQWFKFSGVDQEAEVDAFDQDMAAKLEAETEAFNGADPEKFDHDKDGKPGGAPKGGNRKKPATKA